ncbi:MAG: tetratricopeptide repeat protein [PVC group bacterium]
MRIKRQGTAVPLIAILLAGLVLRLIYLGEIRDTPDFSHPGLDAAYHIYWARGMASGDWTDFEGREDPQIYRYPYYRPPGYAYFLTLVYLVCGMSPLWPRLVQFALGLGSALLAFTLARRFFGAVGGLLSALAVATYWIFIYYEGELVDVAWAVFLSLLFAGRLARAARFSGFLIAGLALGVLIIFRPNAALLYPFVLAWVIIRGRRRGEKSRVIAAGGGLLAGVLLAVLPVTIRNYAVSGELVPISTVAGISLGVANNELTDGTTHFIPGLGNIGTPYDWPRIVRRLENILGRRLSHAGASSYLSRQAFCFALRSPGDFFLLLGRKALLFWGPAEIRNLKEVHYARLHSPLLRKLPGNFSLAAALAVLGAVLIFLPRRVFGPGVVAGTSGEKGAGGRRGPCDREREGGGLMVIWIVAYFFSMLPFAAAARYRVPVIPFLLILSSCAVRQIGLFAGRRKWVSALAASASGAALYLLFSVNFSGFQPAPEKWHYDRGLARLEAGRWEEAVWEFDRALEHQPGYAAAYTNRGVALQKGGKPGAAIASYRRSLQLDPDSPRALKNLADALLETGETEEALALYRQAVSSFPEYTGISCDLAQALSRAGREDEAAELYRAILREQPDNARAHLELGNLLLERDLLPAAREQYQMALRVNPHSAVARYNLANVLIREGRIEEGIASYREVLRRDPGHRDAHNNLGIQLAARGRLAPALAHFEEAIQIDPRDPAGYYNRGIALIKIGRGREAIFDLEKTLELSPGYEPALRALGVARKGGQPVIGER